MSLNKLQEGISSATVQRLTTSLAEHKSTVLEDGALMDTLTGLKQVITTLEDARLARQSQTAAGALSAMTEEERRLLLMWPEEKTFFLRYKKQHPENPWGYYEEYRKAISEAYNQNGELPSL